MVYFNDILTDSPSDLLRYTHMSKPKAKSGKERFQFASALFSMVDPNCTGHIDRVAFAKLCTLATQKMQRVEHGQGCKNP